MLTTDGSVLLIDDDIKESSPLMNLLSKHHIPFIYQSGDPHSFPETPYTGIRIIFLDLVLGTDLESQNSKTQISKVISVLQSLITPDNGPYFIIAWTKHDDQIPLLIERLNESKLKNNLPLNTLSLEKTTYMRTDEHGQYIFKPDALELISKTMKEKLSELGSFRLLLAWESIIKSAGIKTINSFNNVLIESGKKWNERFGLVFYEMAKASMGKNININDPNFTSKALLSFNAVLADFLEKEIKNFNYEDFKITETSEQKTEDLIGTINQRLLFHENPENIFPGNIYPLSDRVSVDELLINSILKDSKPELKKTFTSKCTFVMVDFTAICDYAQNKIGLHKLVAGFILPKEYESILIKHSHFLYISPTIKYANNISLIVLNSKFIFGKKTDELAKIKPILSIRQQFLVDLQSKIAHYINRPGMIFIDS
jgi:hypothetical protein